MDDLEELPASMLCLEDPPIKAEEEEEEEEDRASHHTSPLTVAPMTKNQIHRHRYQQRRGGRRTHWI